MNEIDRLKKERLEWFLLCKRFAYQGTNTLNSQSWNQVFDDYLRLRGTLEDPRE